MTAKQAKRITKRMQKLPKYCEPAMRKIYNAVVEGRSVILINYFPALTPDKRLLAHLKRLGYNVNYKNQTGMMFVYWK